MTKGFFYCTLNQFSKEGDCTLLVTTPHFSTQILGPTPSFLDTGLSFGMNALWRFKDYFVIFSMQFLYLISVMTLFMMSVEVRSPLIMETITVPCLKILLRLVKPPPPSSKNNKVHTCVPSLCCGQIDHALIKTNSSAKQIKQLLFSGGKHFGSLSGWTFEVQNNYDPLSPFDIHCNTVTLTKRTDYVKQSNAKIAIKHIIIAFISSRLKNDIHEARLHL